MTSIQETKLSVPVDLVRRSCGISLDMGGSVFKAIYRKQEDLQEANETTTDMGHMTLLAVSGDRIEEAIQHLSTRAIIDRSLCSGLVYTTGLGCSAKRKLLADRLNIKVESMAEFDCFVKAFVYLASHLPRSELCEPFDDEAAEKPLARAQKLVEVFQSLNIDGSSSMFGMDGKIETENGKSEDLSNHSGDIVNSVWLPMAKAENDLYPCMLAMCGSGFAFMKINADGSFQFCDGSSSGGRNFLGLGCLLTGVETFDELLDLASRGNPYSTHTYAEELFHDCRAVQSGSEEGENGTDNGVEEETMYSRFANMEGIVFYCFGKCVGKKITDYSREDLARGLVEKMVLDTVQLISINCRLAGVTRVCFAGSFFNSPLLRNLTTTELVSKNMFNSMTGQTPLKFDFLKPGPQLGAIGALLRHYEKYVTGASK